MRRWYAWLLRVRARDSRQQKTIERLGDELLIERILNGGEGLTMWGQKEGRAKKDGQFIPGRKCRKKKKKHGS